MKIERTPGPVGESRVDKNRRLQAERDAERDAAALAKREEQLKTNPLRLLKLIARAAKYLNDNVSFTVHEGETDPAKMVALACAPQLRVTFKFARRPGTSDYYTDNQEVFLFGDAYTFEDVEREFDEIDAQKAAEARRLEIARAAYDRLSEEERVALGVRRP